MATTNTDHNELNQFPEAPQAQEWKDLMPDQQRVEADKHIEELGGTDAFAQAILESHSAPADQSPPIDRLKENNIVVTVRFITPGIHTWVQIHTMDGHAGRGSGGALGAAVGDVTGVLNYSSWEALMSAPNTFAIASAGVTIGGYPTQGIVIRLSIDGKGVGAIVAGGTGVGAFVGLSGTIIWSLAS